MTSILDVAAMVEEIYWANSGGCYPTERVQEIEVDAGPLPPRVEATHKVFASRDPSSPRATCTDRRATSPPRSPVRAHQGSTRSDPSSLRAP